ncbi:MAG TPA: CDP-alcohol phosphatidyltransferase family protein [Candidatus Limnocylindrales bacterium]|nr:CDP-alcohol phosphatidyltransferase family protein [Candidatus Limnocylindrales bacterium]
MSPADALAVLRALAVIPIWYAVAYDERGWAIAIFGIAAVTDAVDGWLARRSPLSKHGGLIDPIADKILVLGTALALVFAGLEHGVVIPPELFALLAVREVTSGVIRLSGYHDGTHRSADGVGKLKTAAELTALAVLIVVRPPAPLGVAAISLLWIAVLFGLVTLAQYWSHGRRRLS